MMCFSNLIKKNWPGLCWMFLLFASCKDTGNHNSEYSVISYPSLRSDTINVFHQGDTFVLNISENSCCTQCWFENGTLNDKMKFSSLLESAGSSTSPADPDCAGCSSNSEMRFRCVNSGLDTIQLAVIENGFITEFGTGCEYIQLDTTSMKTQDVLLESFIKNYIIRVLPR